MMAAKKTWTQDHDRYLKEHYSISPVAQVCATLEKTEMAVRNRARKLGLKGFISGSWSEFENDRLRKLFPVMANQEIAIQLARSVSAVRNQAIELNLKKSGHFWRPSQVKFLLENYGTLSMADLKKKLKRTRWAIIHKHRELNGKRKTGSRIIYSELHKDDVRPAHHRVGNDD